MRRPGRERDQILRRSSVGREEKRGNDIRLWKMGEEKSELFRL